MKGFEISNPAKRVKEDLCKNNLTRRMIFCDFDAFKKWDLSIDDGGDAGYQ